MPRYVIERNVPGITEEELQAAGKRSIKVLESMPEVTWIKSYISVAEGKIYCEYEAPNPEAIIEHGKRANLPVDKITLVEMEVDPSMFR
jgi:Nickel responsive protein SCO4226-like